MTYISSQVAQATEIGDGHVRTDPRMMMYLLLPKWIQPFLTWLTARPAPGESITRKEGITFLTSALLLTFLGVGITCAGLYSDWRLRVFVEPIGLLLTTSGLGLFQVVVFHHCSHWTIFVTRERNRGVGRLIAALLLFKNFDAYQHEHMLHHSANKLLTDEDEFADFVFSMCRLEPELPKRELWRRVLTCVFSPSFHARFLRRRIKASLCSPDRACAAVGAAAWIASFGLAAATGQTPAFLIAWVLPVTVLLQIATVFRILCEHRFPPPELIVARGKEFICRSTSGVFPGTMPPAHSARTLRGLALWAVWWLDMLTVQVFVRLFVLVGDAPCHDFHHRRPATRRWTDYIHARQNDADAGCPGFPLNYFETWGLFRAIDQNLATLSNTPRDSLFASRPG